MVGMTQNGKLSIHSIGLCGITGQIYLLFVKLPSVMVQMDNFILCELFSVIPLIILLNVFLNVFTI